jgi:hypothetical protein
MPQPVRLTAAVLQSSVDAVGGCFHAQPREDMVVINTP